MLRRGRRTSLATFAGAGFGRVPVHGAQLHDSDPVNEIATRYGFMVANVFHAGDGNLHPCILFDERETPLNISLLTGLPRPLLQSHCDLG